MIPSIYQIYPLSFKDSNSDGYGDINGIREKLKYIKDLGVNIIWLSPIFRSPMKDFGYDVSDYYTIDPVFGTMKDFENLIGEVHEMGMQILLDYVPNHTSDQHKWFIDSRSSTKSPKRNWFVWRKGKEKGVPPNNWISAFGGSAWEYDKKTNEWYLHDFLKEQPDLNWRNPEVKQEMFTILDFWLKKGIDGFRLDAMAFLFEDSRFSDDPVNQNFNQKRQAPHFNLPEVKQLLLEMVHFVSKYPHTILLTEIYDSLDKIKDMYIREHTTTNIPFNFDLIYLKWDALLFKKTIDAYDATVGLNSTPNYVLSNHDQPRIATRVGVSKARLLAFLQLTLRGIPIIYYGDELGMVNTQVDAQSMKDHLGVHVESLFCRDGERSPMQWNGARFSGFSPANPWLAIHNNYHVINVETELKDPYSFLNLYKKLLLLRNRLKAIGKGTYHPLTIKNINVFGFIRAYGSERLLVLLNFSAQKEVVSIPFEAELLFSSVPKRKHTEKISSTLILHGYEGIILKAL